MANDKEGTEEILLSIIIPTKNRDYTCLYAIESALALKESDVEIIVQDCSDSSILKDKIFEKFGDNRRISYEYSDANPSMTENWNRAFERATGLYNCGIGDDDMVLHNIYDLALFAKNNDIDALGHGKQYEYFWPDYDAIPGFANKLVLVNPAKIPDLKILDRKNLEQLLIEQATRPGMDYRKLPMVYHCMISSRVINTVVQKTGKFLDGTSLDVYSAFSLGLHVNKYYISGVPFTLPGACGRSNSNRWIKRKKNDDFPEFKNIESDKRIPPVKTLTFSIAESMQKAFVNNSAPEYALLLDLPYLYMRLLTELFTAATFGKIFKFMRENDFSLKDYFRFAALLLERIFVSIYRKTGNALKKMTGAKSSERSIYEANNILAAADLIPLPPRSLPGNNNAA